MKKLRQFCSTPLSSVSLIVAVSVFVALFSNLAYFKAAIGMYGLSGYNAIFVGFLFFYITSLFVIVLSLLCHRRLIKPLLVGFLLLSSVIAYFTDQYSTIFDHAMIGNILETRVAEARDLYNFKLIVYVALLGVLPSIAIYFARLDHPHWKIETIARIRLLAVAVLTLAVFTFGFSARLTAMKHEHREIAGKVNPTYALFSAVKLFKRTWLTRSYAHQVVGADANIPKEDVDRELVIMVVGETVRADHLSLNGYGRDTNPRLKHEDVISFANFWSCETSTAKSVPCMFSHFTRAQFSRPKARAADNALDVLKRAGVSILWRDNNSDSKGVADHVTYQQFHTPKTNPVCNSGECRDEGMLHGLQDYIDHQKGDILIVLHQMGNHGPAYYKRYPAQFEQFKPVCRTNDLGSCSTEQISNAYDNALLYTDYFLSKIIALLKRNDEEFETAMMYVSDHGESLGELGQYLHATPYILAPDAQKHIPFVMWFGKHIRHEIVLDDIAERRIRRFSHDNIFSTLLGLFEIRSEAYDADMDIFKHSENEFVRDR